MVPNSVELKRHSFRKAAFHIKIRRMTARRLRVSTALSLAGTDLYIRPDLWREYLEDTGIEDSMIGGF